MKMDRREFLESLFGFGVASLIGGCATGNAGDARPRAYRVAVLGDTHYDKAPESVYHSHYDESNKWAKVQHEEFRRNGEMWRERCPALVAASAKTLPPPAFLLQLGDLVQGDCDDAATHEEMLEDAVEAIRRPFDCPFFTVVGNHDIRGKGAREAYKNFIKYFMFGDLMRLGATKIRKDGHVASFDYEGDRWMFCDFESRDIARLVKALDAAGDARHVFLVTHGPFTTPDAKSFRWRLAGREACDAARPLLYEALSRRHAIVLSGHTHTTAFYRHENESGGFTELTVNSVWAAPEQASAEVISSGAEGYGEIARKTMPAEKLAAYEEQLAFFRPGLKEYLFFGSAAGHYDLDVREDAVTARFYPGAAETAARSFDLK